MSRSLLRRAAVLGAVAASFLTIGAGNALAAVICAPTDFIREGRPMTAALVNPAVVPEHVDATSCDIGIYYSSTVGGTGGTLQDKHVFGATHYGIVARGTVNVVFRDGSIYDIEDDPSFTGVQHGVGIAIVEGATVTVERSQIYDFQKNGFAADGAGSTLNVTDSIVRGKGPTPLIAQNGIQFSNGADGSAAGNFIEDHFYTGCSKQDAKATGCDPVISTGILLFNVDPNAIDIRNNTFRDNQVNLLNAQ